MKDSIICVFILGLLFTGCGINQSNNNLSGTYVNNSRSEYSIAFDTLILSKKSASNYEVERRTGFQKVRKGTVLPREFKSEKWTALWNQETMVLSETELGRQITPGQDRKALNFKNTQYLKIK